MTDTTSVSIALDAIVVLEDANPRKTFDDAQLKELANSIKAIGLLNPITVRATADGTGYELVAGHRRYLAVSSLKHDTIDAVVYPAEWTDGAIAAVAENVARADLNPVDEARAYRELSNGGKTKPKALAALVGRSEKHVKDRLALLALPERVLELFAVSALSPRVAPVLFPVAKLSPDVASWLAVVASQSSYATEILVHNLPGALKDLRKDVASIDAEADPPFVVHAQDYMMSENREALRRVISDELATKIAELPQFCINDPWRMGTEEADAAVAYGAALDLSAGHYRTVFILDPEWAADRVAVNYELALKRALAAAEQKATAQAPGGHEHVHVQKRQADKAMRDIESRLAPRVHERNAAIGRAILKHKFKADPMAIKLLAILAAEHLNSTPASAWALADESIGKPEVSTRKDGSTKFKLVVAETPYQLQQDLVRRVHEAKTIPQLLRLVLGPILAASVVDGRSVTQSNRPARINFDHIAGTQDVKDYLVELAKEFDFEKPYEVPLTEEEKAARAAVEAAETAHQELIDAAQAVADDLQQKAEHASEAAEECEDPEQAKVLEHEAEEAWKADEQAEEHVTDLWNSGPAAVAGGEDELDDDEEEDEDASDQPAIDLPDEDTAEHDAVDDEPGDVEPDLEAGVDDTTAQDVDQVDEPGPPDDSAPVDIIAEVEGETAPVA